jgi:hypothetical protein
MLIIDRADFEQLIVQLEQDWLLQAQHFSALLVAKNPALAAHYRRKLRTVTVASRAFDVSRDCEPPH